MKCPEEANPQKQKLDYRFEVSFWCDKKVQQLESGDYCTTLNTLKTTESHTLRG